MNIAVIRDYGTSPVDADISRIARTTRCIAIVGMSPKETRPSWWRAISSRRAYRIVPVNPVYAGRAILGEHVYPSLHTIPHELDVDMVDIFRHAEAVPGVVADALACSPKLRTIWMQLAPPPAGGQSRPRAGPDA